jgi:hypothetical protein
MLRLFAALAEKERALISQRTKAALAAAKARGQTLGNPKLAEARAIAHASATAGADAFAGGVEAAILKPKPPGRRRFGISPPRSTAGASRRRAAGSGLPSRWRTCSRGSDDGSETERRCSGQLVEVEGKCLPRAYRECGLARKPLSGPRKP